MSEILRDVEVRLRVPEIKGAGQLQDLARSTGTTEKAVDALAQSWNKLTPAARGALGAMVQGTKEAAAGVRQLGQELERTGQKAQSLSGRDWKRLAGATGLGGAFKVGKLGMIGGGLGAFALAGNEAYAALTGGRGMVSGAAIDLLEHVGGVSGARKEHESELRRMEREIGTRERADAQVRAVRERVFEATNRGNTSIAEDPYKRYEEELGGLERGRSFWEREQRDSGRRYRQQVGRYDIAVQTANAYQAEQHSYGATVGSKHFGIGQYSGNLEEGKLRAMREMQAAAQGIAAAERDHQAASMKVLETEEKITQLKLKQLEGARHGIRKKELSYARMDPWERQRTQELGMRLAQGGQLSEWEMQEARANPILQQLTEQKDIAGVEQMPEFTKLIQATGTQAEREIASKAIQANATLSVTMNWQEDQLRAELERQVKPLGFHIEKVAEELRRVMDIIGKNKAAADANAGARH